MDHPQQMEKIKLSGQSGVSRNRTFIRVDIWWWVIPNIKYLIDYIMALSPFTSPFLLGSPKPL